MIEENNFSSNGTSTNGNDNPIVSLLKNKFVLIAAGAVVLIVIIALLFTVGPLGGKVAAKVNGKKIYLTEVEEQYKVYLNQLKLNKQPKPNKEQEKNIKSVLLDRLVSKELVKQAAEEAGVKVSKKEIDQSLANIKKQTSPKQLKDGLKKMGWDMDDLSDYLKDQLVETKLRQSKTKSIKITEKDAKKYYEDNKKTDTLISTPEQINVQIIRVTNKSDAEKILNDGSVNFDKSAKKYAKTGYQPALLQSKDQIKISYSPELADAVFNLSKGDTTGVIKINGGWAVAKAEGDKQAGYQKKYSEVKQVILANLKSQKEFQAYEKFMQDFKKKAEIEILIKELKPQQPQIPPQPGGGGGR